jgi:hypothetical protein
MAITAKPGSVVDPLNADPRLEATIRMALDPHIAAVIEPNQRISCSLIYERGCLAPKHHYRPPAYIYDLVEAGALQRCNPPAWSGKAALGCFSD